jgi:predicted dehydrogenase
MNSVPTKPLRHVVIGVGAGIFKSHRPCLALPTVDLVAVSDINATVGKQRAEELGCVFYEDYRRMLAEIRPDVAIVITPPFLHASIAIDCLQAGCHVLVEKPMAIQVAEADAMIETAQRHNRLLGVVFQKRFRSEIITAQKFLQEGLLGDIQHVELTAVWTRPTSYYTMAPWRATWAGEGGGILTNQSSHNLDILCYLIGNPTRIFAWTRQLLHDIETEDTVQAMLEWPNGALGSVHISAAEADDPERLKIVGTRGILQIGIGSLHMQLLDSDIREYAATSQDPYAQPQRQPDVAVPLEKEQNHFMAVYQHFHEAILQGGKSSSDGADGRSELELANAMIYSSYNHCEVVLPLDRQRYASLLKELQQSSKYHI